MDGLGQRFVTDGLDGEDPKKTKSDPLHLPQGPITRSRARKLQQALIGYFQDWANQLSPIHQDKFKAHEDHEDWALFNTFKVQVQE